MNAWELVDDGRDKYGHPDHHNTYRMPVVGGWIYKHAGQLVFVPDVHKIIDAVTAGVETP